ncbi:hypothetical protein [Haloferula sp.]|uniref:hypothetical protein n=1 Tax=Haloferula sp. TaxID=2497595 RepID=UPI0032A03581
MALLLGACSEEEIRTYRVASEESESPVVAPSADGGASQDLSVVWHAQEGWAEEPAGQFQLAVYGLGPDLRVTVSMLPGEAGGVAANVNRWRGQVALDPLVASEITGAEVPGFEGEGELKLHELLGESGSGILAGILRLSGETWFFKMSGPVDELTDHRSSFLTFLASIETKEGSGFGDQGPPAAKSEEPKKPKIDFEVPEGWTVGEESPMRVASFRAAGEDGFQADIAVVPLPGDSGSILDNINRWRAQLQLEELEDENDPAVGKAVDGPVGTYFLTHMKSEETIVEDEFQGAISAAIIKGDKYTWFLRMSGEARVVEANRSNFESFVESVRFP